MEKRNVQISLDKAREWYKQGGDLRKIALQAFSEDELKEPSKPRSWREFCENYRVNSDEFYINDDSDIITISSVNRKRLIDRDRNLCTSKEETEAFRALMQLRQLRKAWIGDWKPNWKNPEQRKYCVFVAADQIRIDIFSTSNRTLSFPTKEMVEEFLNDFRDLLETAKPLL